MYSVNKITTLTECEAVIKLADQTKNDLLFRKSLVERSLQNAAGSTDEVNAEIQVTEQEISAIGSILLTLPDGKTKEKYVRKQVSFQNRLNVLGFRRSDYGAVSLLEKEWKLARLEKELEETDALLDAVNIRKAEL